MFFYTIMSIFITLFENVNKSCNSAGRLSLKEIFVPQINSEFCFKLT
jgi:hypothetical protein